MLGHSPGIHQNFPPHVFNEQTWLLAKYTSLSGSPKVTVEGNVRAVFSAHRRQLSVWHENRMLICIDLHYAKTTVPTKDCYAIVKESNVSLCRLKFRSLPDRVSFGAALADLVHVANDRGASQDVSSQGWQASHGTSSSSQAEFNSSQGKMESGTLIEPELEYLPQPTRVSTPLSGLQLSATDSSPWRCYFDKNVSPISRSTDPDSNFKKPILLPFIAEKKNEYVENNENYPPGEGMISPSPIGDAPEESSILKRLNESMELFNDDHSRSMSDISETVALDGDKLKMKRENSIILIEDEDDEEVMNSIENETEAKREEEKIEDEVVESDEGECGMTHSFIARLREIPKKNKLKDGDVIRVKEDRAQMHGQDCPCCREYYDALGLNERERISRVDNISRHRFVARPMPQTPPHYWEIDFPSEEEQRRRGFLNNN